MLNIHNLSVSFGGEFLFEEISFRLNPGDKIGLVGKNGAGKSTLLRLLSKDMQADSGVIASDKEVKVGFLKQDIDFEIGRTVLEEAHLAFHEIKKLEGRLEDVNMQLANREDYESDGYNQLLIDLNEITHQYEVHGGYQYQGETEKVLMGLGFKRAEFENQTDTFSGGWRMRIELAKLLLQNNDVLLLDEPTNHLDIESIIWLEQFLKTYAGALVLVSHDKMFLDNITNRTIEISLGRIYDYNKPYSQFLEFRKEIRGQQLSAQKNQEKQIQQTEKLIEKFRAKASKASMVQSLIKKLDRLERIEVDEEDDSVMKVHFPVSVQPGKVIVEGKGLGKRYGDKKVFEDVELMVNRGDKIAFVGQNGQGKTTLARIIIGALDHSGTLTLGHNVQLGYFAQNQADYLDELRTIHDTMLDAASEGNRTKVRDVLGSFLFRGDDVEKQVKVLSGGERNRLALAKMLLQPFNVLIMDEPTNHLDMKSKNVLKQALNNFGGTLILVSHDRDFLQGLTDKVYEFKDGNIKEFLGDIDSYLDQRQALDFRTIEKKKVTSGHQSKNETSTKNDYQEQKRLKSLKNKLGSVEKKITALEKEIAEMDHQLLMEYEQTVSSPSFFDNYHKKKGELNILMEEWEVLSNDLEQ